MSLSIEKIREGFEKTKQSIEAEYARVADLLKKCEADLHYLRGRHDAIKEHLAALGAPVSEAASPAPTADVPVTDAVPAATFDPAAPDAASEAART